MRKWVKRRTLFALLAIAVVCLLFLAFWAGGRREVPLDGTYQSGFEQSAFIPDGNCSKKPFWFHWPDDYDMNARIKALGYPAALRVKLIGNVSRLGKYGHLGAYPREVWPIKIISVDPAPPCRQGSPKPDFYDEVSQTLIGKQITIRGKFSLWGKIGPYIALDERQEVYLIHRGSFTWGKPYSEMDGKFVAATGVLRFYRAPPAVPTDRTVARAPDYFYFEVETAQVRLISGNAQTESRPRRTVKGLPRYMTDIPQPIPEQIKLPDAPKTARDVRCFASFTTTSSMKDVVRKCGIPDEHQGSGIYIFVYDINDGSVVVIGTSDLNHLMYVNHITARGSRSLL